MAVEMTHSVSSKKNFTRLTLSTFVKPIEFLKKIHRRKEYEICYKILKKIKTG